MNRIFAGGVAALVALTVAGVWWAVRPLPAAPERPARDTSEVVFPARVSPGYSGCAAYACHGGPVDPKADNPARWAFNAWSDRDKHTRAYAVLSESRGVAMMRCLTPPDELERGIVRDATKDARCLACHSLPTSVYTDKDHWGAVTMSREAVALRDQGVTCAACHGPAELWDYDHLDWDRRHKAGESLKGMYEKKGVWWLNGSVERGRVCAGCHVGAPADPATNTPARDVNHDIIAAGHPRLSFELSQFLANMPPHWKERDRETGATRGPAFEACAWQAGQYTNLEATLKLAVWQATPAKAGEAYPPVWPELTQFDCYACHHEIKVGGPRKEVPTEGRRPGDAWANRWYASLPLRRLTADDPAVTKPLAGYEKAMYRFDTRKVVREQATAVLAGLKPRIDALAARPDGPCEVEPLLTALRWKEGEAGKLLWDDAAQLYLALSALDRAKPDAARTAKLTELAKTLRMAPGNDTPAFPDLNTDAIPLLEGLLRGP